MYRKVYRAEIIKRYTASVALFTQWLERKNDGSLPALGLFISCSDLPGLTARGFVPDQNNRGELRGFRTSSD
jgi:hypothetical protein